jgi:hypothetical protein
LVTPRDAFDRVRAEEREHGLHIHPKNAQARGGWRFGGCWDDRLRTELDACDGFA